MARKRSTRKRPERDDFMLKEQKKVESMLDKGSMVYLSKFYNKGIIGRLGLLMARGKESDIYVASAGSSEEVKGEEYVILKFFRVETSTFFNMSEYIIGDPRFKKISSRKMEIVKTWCKKEFGNLILARRAEVHAPRPYMFNGNILAMQYIDDGNGVQAPQLRNTLLDKETAKKVCDLILQDIRKLYLVKLVHGDLSEYNILIRKNVPYMIDLGQGVVLRHPNATYFLKRDVINVLSYFRKTYGIEKSPEEEYRRIIA